ncbi:HNH/ENDO VII family nuclease [Mycobacterium sp. NPDC050853]|uniref:HNH/ENDO VII family nuclease n=1 Tax=Mycobacterium sp. NPDC050853 TaxID=3155160 RepID=UPI0033FF448F
MTIIFDIGVVKDAASKFGNMGGLFKGKVNSAGERLADSGGMAGTDSAGQKFAKEYDALAKEALALGATTVNAILKAADLLDATAHNHGAADSPTVVPDKYKHLFPPGWTPPPQNRSPMQTPTAPASLGAKAAPSWWETIKDHVEGAAWPNGDPEKLRNASNTWNTLANEISDLAFQVDAPGYGQAPGDGPMGQVGSQVSPEIPDVMANLAKARDGLDDTVSAFHAAGMACVNYARDIDDVHNRISNEIILLAATVAATEFTAAILIPLTVGASEAVSKVVDLTRLEEAGRKIALMIREFIAAAEMSTMPAISASAQAVTAAARVAPLASANISLLAAEEAGLLSGEVAGNLNTLYPRVELRVGTKRAIENATQKTADGKYFVVKSDDSVRVLADRTGTYGSDILSLPKTADGKYFIDGNGLKYPVDSKYDIGHVKFQEFWRLQQEAQAGNWSRQRWLDEMNNPKLYEIQDIPGNRSHRYEATP